MDALSILRQIQGEWVNLGDFVAYVIPGAKVQATLLGLLLYLKVDGAPSGFVGAAVLSHDVKTRRARFVREASDSEAIQYLSQFPRSIAVVFRNKYGNWLGVSNGEVIPIYGIDDYTQEFETVRVYCIGDTWVFNGMSTASNPSLSASLRAAFENRSATHPKIPYSTPDHKMAYVEKTVSIIRPVSTIASAVEFMGGKLIDLVERNDGTSLVTYTIENQTFTSLVSNSNMQVISSGICLDGRDTDFDLTTLMPVMRKGVRDGRIHNVGLGGYAYNDDFDDD